MKNQFKKIEIELSNLNKKINSYEYKYYNLSENGELIPFHKDSSRKTFEEFKNNNVIGIPGETSLRTITKENNVIGFVSEKRIKNTEFIEAGMEIYLEAINIFIEKYQIKDKKAFFFFIEETSGYQIELGQGSFNEYQHNLEYLLEIAYKIDENIDDFKRYFYKLVS